MCRALDTHYFNLHIGNKCVRFFCCSTALFVLLDGLFFALSLPFLVLCLFGCHSAIVVIANGVVVVAAAVVRDSFLFIFFSG